MAVHGGSQASLGAESQLNLSSSPCHLACSTSELPGSCKHHHVVFRAFLPLPAACFAFQPACMLGASRLSSRDLAATGAVYCGCRPTTSNVYCSSPAYTNIVPRAALPKSLHVKVTIMGGAGWDWPGGLRGCRVPWRGVQSKWGGVLSDMAHTKGTGRSPAQRSHMLTVPPCSTA